MEVSDQRFTQLEKAAGTHTGRWSERGYDAKNSCPCRKMNPDHSHFIGISNTNTDMKTNNGLTRNSAEDRTYEASIPLNYLL
jgi:hypothetical protein